jgi:hypothetical protein
MQSWSPHAITKGAFGSFMSASKLSSVAKTYAKSRFTNVGFLSEPSSSSNTAWAGRESETGPYQKTQSSDSPYVYKVTSTCWHTRIGSSAWLIFFAIFVNASTSPSWLVKYSRARGWTYPSQVLRHNAEAVETHTSLFPIHPGMIEE